MKLITHDNCADGLATAMIALAAIPGIEVVFAQYGQPSLERLEPGPGLIFCDITPPRERAHEFVAVNAIVLDHHKHARDIVEMFGQQGVFADEATEQGVSGALLAYRNIWKTARQLGGPTPFGHAPGLSHVVEDFAILAGIRDTWQTSSPRWERAQDLHAVLMGLPREYWLRPGGIDRALDADSSALGQMFRRRKTEQVQDLCDRGTIRMGSWAVFPSQPALMSDAAEELRSRGCAVALGWFQIVKEGKVHTVCSLRSDGSVDVGDLCKRHGGGGHSRAAGCTLPTSDPLQTIALLTS